MQLPKSSSDSHSGANPKHTKLIVTLASTRQEIREIQRLRYSVFIDTFRLSKLSNSDELNTDEFDDYCDHLIVRDTKTSQIVGTCRLMSPTVAQRIGHYYCEQEFDLSRINLLQQRIIEAGHACVHPDYRSGSVIMLLWSGLATYMQRERCDYLVGCASVSLADGGHNASALCHAFTAQNFAPSEYRVTPHNPFPLHERNAGHVPQMPPLLKGYLRSGAWVCGEPAWDPEFNTADFFMLLPLSKLDSRYARHYLKTDKTAQLP
ncbi:GNAT family N-acetyltransferase [Pseudomonas gessardii]|uniref:L-ornithine N(alpha)-acyltransferase n=1 Tax=Pseudomonas gessardii TaxID=78544 RepID=A0A7Y1MQX2_9PSED|nr:GNAT family N-acyltransferase [Pseudomonas gessardii]NNA96726.1 GNAT family N-acetyltransferase [Pseudomonas gessardii]